MITDPTATVEFYTESVAAALAKHPDCTYTGAILASVVPSLTSVLCRAAKKVIHREPLVVSSKMDLGMQIRMDYPEQIGSDLLVAAVAAVSEYPSPMLIIDMGTATTVTAIDAAGDYVGGMILVGAQLSLNALTNGTAQLPALRVEAPQKMLGKNTIDCMQSGAVYGHAAMIDGVIDRAEVEMGMPLNVVTTGGIARVIAPLCRREMIYDNDLLMKGLWLLYQRNHKEDGQC